MTTQNFDIQAINHQEFFADRHIGINLESQQKMLQEIGLTSLERLVQDIVPERILTKHGFADLPKAASEVMALTELKNLAQENKIFRSYIGTGYYGTNVPKVIQRNVLENPGWYTQYTPYQAEIAQGRLEALLNFQTMIIDLTGLPIANASLLDEGTAAAEAMAMAFVQNNRDTSKAFFVAKQAHPQTIEVLKTRARGFGIKLIIQDHREFDFKEPIFGALIQYPETDGSLHYFQDFIAKVQQQQGLVVFATDLLALTILKSPAEWGADIAIGSAQRFGVPMGFGGPHAAFLAAKDELKRLVPGRIIGLSVDAEQRPAARLALQTREQHIRREKAISNICTAQVLLAVMASMYAVYHGPKGLRKIAERVHSLTLVLAKGLERLGYQVSKKPFFDTLVVELGSNSIQEILQAAQSRQINLRVFQNSTLGIALDETVQLEDVQELLVVFNRNAKLSFKIDELLTSVKEIIPQDHFRKTDYLTNPVFNRYHTETEMLRYIRKLESRDLSLTHSMIALGSCTMKLNATAEMVPVSWPEFSQLHPFAPAEQYKGYQKLFSDLEKWLGDITGLPGVSLQPNAGSQGEYAGLLVIKRFHESRGEGHRNICLIPQSAHGTNPASAVMAGFQVVVVSCDNDGNIDLTDLRSKAELHSKNLAGLMVTYPSTHGVYEETITQVCEIVHAHGGQVYMDGANLNAQVGLTRPGEFGADVCHLNLHKTFCIPHGGGGPGMGPICTKSHLTAFLPNHYVAKLGREKSIGTIAAAPWGSASILPISWMYIKMMGASGLKRATEVALLNANYVAHRLNHYFPVLYKGKKGRVAHECIIDMRKFKTTAQIEVEDIAKRLMDYGFHAPTVSFPVPGTMMIEPTESESKEELDRFCEAMIEISKEIAAVESGKASKTDNVLKNAPHSAFKVMSSDWNHSYSREQAAFPLEWVKDRKFWPFVSRINSVQGDRNLICSCN